MEVSELWNRFMILLHRSIILGSVEVNQCRDGALLVTPVYVHRLLHYHTLSKVCRGTVSGFRLSALVCLLSNSRSKQRDIHGTPRTLKFIFIILNVRERKGRKGGSWFQCGQLGRFQRHRRSLLAAAAVCCKTVRSNFEVEHD